MRYIRSALVDIFSHKIDPWAAVVRWCTVDRLALSHSPVVVLDLNGGVIRGRQLVYSSPMEHPLGFVPRCPRAECDALPGDVVGKSSGYGDDHSQFRLRCKVCKHQCWVTRPEWVKPVSGVGSYFFETPWPISEDQLNEVLGPEKDWTLANEVEPIEGSGSGDMLPTDAHRRKTRRGKNKRTREEGAG